MANILQKLAFATASVALSIAALDINPAQAATMTYDFKVVPDSGPLLGNEYTGSFSYDDEDPSIVADIANGIPISIPVFEFEFVDFDGNSVSYNPGNVLSPVEAFFDENDEFMGLSLSGNDFSFHPGFALDEAYVSYDIDSGAGAADIIYKKVPEPSSVLGLIFMGSSMLLVGKKVRSAKRR